MSGQPIGWTKTNLRELFEFKYGRGLIQQKRRANGSTNVYGSNGVVGKHDEPMTKGPTIIVGRKGSVGEVNFSSKPCWAIDTTYYIDEFPCGLPPVYWALYLKSLRLGQAEKSSAIPGISRDDIYSIEVSLAPLDEQLRIVTKLEKLLSRVDAAQARLATVPRILKRFRQSVLAAACSGRLTADWRKKNEVTEEYEPVVVEDVADYVGGFAYKSPTFIESGENQVIRIGNVRPFALKLGASPVFVPTEIAKPRSVRHRRLLI